MRSGATTRGQLLKNYERLKKRFENLRLPYGLQKDFVAVAKAVLDMYPIISSSSTSSPMPDVEKWNKLSRNFFLLPLTYSMIDFFALLSLLW